MFLCTNIFSYAENRFLLARTIILCHCTSIKTFYTNPYSEKVCIMYLLSIFLISFIHWFFYLILTCAAVTSFSWCEDLILNQLLCSEAYYSEGQQVTLLLWCFLITHTKNRFLKQPAEFIFMFVDKQGIASSALPHNLPEETSACRSVCVRSSLSLFTYKQIIMGYSPSSPIL